jgi:hypothetical protein
MNITADMQAAWEHISKDIERVKIGVHSLQYSKDVIYKELIYCVLNSIEEIDSSLEFVLTGTITKKQQEVINFHESA